MIAERWIVGFCWAAECRTVFFAKPSSPSCCRTMGATMRSVAGRFFARLGRFRDGLPAARKPVVSVSRAVRTVRTVFPTSRQEGEKKKVEKKGKVEIREYRPNRPLPLRPAAMISARKVSA